MFSISKLNTRLVIIYLIVVIVFCLAIGKAIIIKTVERDNWMKLAKQKRERPNRPIVAPRGNIFDCNGKMMASTIPYYYLYMDMRAEGLRVGGDTLFNNNVDAVARKIVEVCESNSKQNKDYLVSSLKKRMRVAFAKKNGRFRLTKNKVTYLQLQEIKKLPFFKRSNIRTGFIPEERSKRVKPFGSLASRTIGLIDEQTNKGKRGLEYAYDDYLIGEEGLATYTLIGRSWMYLPIQEPVPGNDIITTIDIDIQDVAERALNNMLQKVGAESGAMIFMEVKTGEIKAIVNLSLDTQTGKYNEAFNTAFADMTEPGSTFKSISAMIAIEDGHANINTRFDRGNGIWEMKPGHFIRDHDWKKIKDNHVMTLQEGMENSSNIVIAKMIHEHYGKDPQKFFKKMDAIGLQDAYLDRRKELGAAPITIVRPTDKQWDQFLLRRMSIGYATQFPPIAMLTFYNAIANNGKLVRPMIVKKVIDHEEIISEYKTEVINPSICSDKTLKQLQTMLRAVVTNGTGKAVDSKMVPIAGKTGTAKITWSKNKNIPDHLLYQVSFCGYFPADDPKYSGIVVIRRPTNGYPSGGSMSGGAFREVAEKIYIQNSKNTTIRKDSIAKINPLFIANGDEDKTRKAIEILKVKTNKINPEINVKPGIVPNVINMGASDALYYLDKAGLKIKMEGAGRVTKQSLTAGSRFNKGDIIYLQLN